MQRTYKYLQGHYKTNSKEGEVVKAFEHVTRLMLLWGRKLNLNCQIYDV